MNVVLMHVAVLVQIRCSKGVVKAIANECRADAPGRLVQIRNYAPGRIGPESAAR